MSALDQFVKHFARRGYEHAHSEARRLYRETNGDVMAVHAAIQRDKDPRIVQAHINAVESVLQANDIRYDENPDAYIPVSAKFAQAQSEGRI